MSNDRWMLSPDQFLLNRFPNRHGSAEISKEYWEYAKEDGFAKDNYFIIQLNGDVKDKRDGEIGKIVFKNRLNSIFTFVERIKSLNKFDFLKCDLSKVKVEKIEPDKIKVTYQTEMS